MNPPDATETLRRCRLVEINTKSGNRQALERRHGRVWDHQELGREFDILGFLAPYVVARRRSDGTVGSLEFQHHPRLYFNWEEDS